MKKIKKFILEVVIDFIIVLIMSIVFKLIGWLDISPLINAVACTCGFIVGKIIVSFINNRKKKED